MFIFKKMTECSNNFVLEVMNRDGSDNKSFIAE